MLKRGFTQQAETQHGQITTKETDMQKHYQLFGVLILATWFNVVLFLNAQHAQCSLTISAAPKRRQSQLESISLTVTVTDSQQ